MAGTEIVLLAASSRRGARDALRELKRLDREGWVDLIAYELVDRDEHEALHLRDTSQNQEGCGPAAAAELACAFEGGIPLGGCGLAVMIEHRYAERVAQEFEGRGLTMRRRVKHAQSGAALRSSIEEIKSKIAWLEEFLGREAEKAAAVGGGEKERLEAGIRAGRSELAADRGHLQARLLALRGELEAELARRAKKGGAVSEKGKEEIEREVADINEDLALSILDHLNALAAHAGELRERAERSGSGAVSEIAEQLEEVEVHLRKYRADLTATLAASASLARHCADGCTAGLAEHIKKLEQRHALLKADIEQAQKDDSRSWSELTAGDSATTWP